MLYYIQVEDHPYQYRNFEGVIPKGEYGAGPVMIWDEGYWEPLGNPVEDLKKGSMKFILKGRNQILAYLVYLYHLKDTLQYEIQYHSFALPL